MTEILPQSSETILGFKLSGKLHDDDYRKFVPLVDGAIAKVGKFFTTRCTKIDRIALVGEKTWEKWMAKVCKPFTAAKIKDFDVTNIDAAWAWLAEK